MSHKPSRYAWENQNIEQAHTEAQGRMCEQQQSGKTHPGHHSEPITLSVKSFLTLYVLGVNKRVRGRVTDLTTYSPTGSLDALNWVRVRVITEAGTCHSLMRPTWSFTSGMIFFFMCYMSKWGSGWWEHISMPKHVLIVRPFRHCRINEFLFTVLQFRD